MLNYFYSLIDLKSTNVEPLMAVIIQRFLSNTVQKEMFGYVQYLPTYTFIKFVTDCTCVHSVTQLLKNVIVRLQQHFNKSTQILSGELIQQLLLST